MFDGLGTLIYGLMVVCAIAVPLGLWKLIDLAFWMLNHVSIH